MIKEVPDKDATRAIDLVRRVFSEFVAMEYPQQGRDTFEAYLQNILKDASEGRKHEGKKMWAYYQGDEILGVIEIMETSHIALLFVDKAFHGKGIARQLFQTALEAIKQNRGVTHITVNSSNYAAKVYEQLGFVQTGDQQEKDGIVFIPFRLTL